MHAAAERGLSGGAEPLPHLDRIQGAFGGHDVPGVAAHVGGPAVEANRAMGAQAYATGHEASQSFWHANHMQDEGEQGEKQPMIVYQSTKDKFAAGYFDFDRIIYCVGLATGYDPAGAAKAHG